MNLVRSILHLEGLALFVAAIVAYFVALEGWWVAFVALLLLPDVSMIGYVRSTRLGSITYNLVHNYALALALVGGGLALGSTLLTGAGLILLAHVGMDRMLGYGLKFPTRFKDTHFQRLSASTDRRALAPPTPADALDAGLPADRAPERPAA